MKRWLLLMLWMASGSAAWAQNSGAIDPHQHHRDRHLHHQLGAAPSTSTRVVWFLEGMLHHHGAALQMAHDGQRKSTNPAIYRLARQIILVQRMEIRELRRMLQLEGRSRPEYYRYDHLFAL